MSKLKDILKRIGNGLEHAYAGENLSMTKKGRQLNNAPLYVTPVNVKAITNNDDNKDKRRRVGLFMGSELPAGLMNYAIETCASLNHELTVITFQTENTAHAILKSYEKVLQEANIDLKLVALTGDPIKRLTRYLKTHPEIAFLACKDTGYLGHRYINGPKDKNLLPVPVVVVMTKEGEAAKQLEKDIQVSENSEIKTA